MARPRKNKNIDNHIHGLVQAHVSDLVNALTRAVRSNLAEELNQYFQRGKGVAGALLGRKRGVKPGTKRDMSCISPGCKNTSKGPRFRYLCEQHLNASKKDVEAWRKARKEAAA